MRSAPLGTPRTASRDIAIANGVWCMAYQMSGGGEGHVLRKSCNSIAIVWAMQVGGGYNDD